MFRLTVTIAGCRRPSSGMLPTRVEARHPMRTWPALSPATAKA